MVLVFIGPDTTVFGITPVAVAEGPRHPAGHRHRRRGAARGTPGTVELGLLHRLTGTPVSPELHTLGPRLSAIADQVDVLALQRTLASAMLALAGESAGIFYVD